MLRRLPYALLVVMLLVPTAYSEAAPIVYDFTVTFASGPLAPQSFSGSLSVDGTDCPGGVCDGTFVPNDPALTLLSFAITVGGVAFELSHDEGYPFLPLVGITAGIVDTISYFASNPGGGLYIAYGSGRNDVGFSNPQELVSEGSLTIAGEQQVPEPASLSLLGLGLAGLGASRWRQRHGA